MAFKKRKFSKKEIKAAAKLPAFVERDTTDIADATPKAKKKVLLSEIVSVKDFAEISGLPVTEIIGQLIKNGVLANINENIDFETAQIVGDDLGLEILPKDAQAEEFSEKAQVTDSKSLETRPPVVSIMGHVDHGKTSLLDKIRETHVAAGESGGITQHISAYNIEVSDPEDKKKTRAITFIDTPGHSAFSAMRSHGATIADIVVLIVAADDGVMPQTKEVIESAKAQNVPIIVAINKVDLPDSDIMKIRQQLSEYQLIGEDWGGKTIIVEVSAKTGKNIDQLLEMILLQADSMDLKADPEVPATGIVIESHYHKGAGALAIILIENGTLKLGDAMAIGPVYGKVRILQDWTGENIVLAGPSMPVRVAGLKSLPNFAERLVTFESEKEAKNAAKRFLERNTTRRYIAKSVSKTDSDIVELNLIIKSDVAGSLEAIKKSLGEISNPGLKIKIVSDGVGAISESDAAMANATKAVILAFRVSISLPAKKIIDKEKINAVEYQVIYELVDDVKKILEEMLPPIVTEIETGSGEILAEFRNDKKGVVVGFRSNDGEFKTGEMLKIISAGEEIWRGKIESLRREKDQVSSISAGSEAGVGLAAGAKYTIGDKVVAFRIEETKQTL
ncbi:MAG: translation initiation factor IF-2 [Candidatus Berkelbacteria bacterium]|nr:translation initiation factor IF-2 [Candidatus Berkelbacteria bacterium]